MSFPVAFLLRITLAKDSMASRHWSYILSIAMCFYRLAWVIIVVPFILKELQLLQTLGRFFGILICNVIVQNLAFGQVSIPVILLHSFPAVLSFLIYFTASERISDTSGNAWTLTTTHWSACLTTLVACLTTYISTFRRGCDGADLLSVFGYAATRMSTRVLALAPDTLGAAASDVAMVAAIDVDSAAEGTDFNAPSLPTTVHDTVIDMVDPNSDLQPGVASEVEPVDVGLSPGTPIGVGEIEAASAAHIIAGSKR